MFGLQQSQGCRRSQSNGIIAGSGIGLIALLLLGPCAVVASSLDKDIAALKAEVAGHAENLSELERKVHQQVDTRLAVYLTLASGDALDLDAVELFVNGEPVAVHLYTPLESDSLQQGGIQQLFSGNLTNGSHDLKAVITARAANDHFVRRESSHRFQKRPGTLRLQMALDAKAPDYEPRVSFDEWN